MSMATELKRLSEKAQNEWQEAERVSMCATWLVRSVLAQDGGFPREQWERLARQLEKALGEWSH